MSNFQSHIFTENRMCKNNFRVMLVLSGKWTCHGISEIDSHINEGWLSGKMEQICLWVVQFAGIQDICFLPTSLL